MQVYTHVLAGQQAAAASAVEAHLLGRPHTFADVSKTAFPGPMNANRDEG
jgi:hypothetical protein